MLFSLEDIDNFMDEAEPWVAATSLTAETASLIPGAQPFTIPAAVGSNIVGAGIDLYQGIRSAIKGDWGGG